MRKPILLLVAILSIVSAGLFYVSSRHNAALSDNPTITPMWCRHCKHNAWCENDGNSWTCSGCGREIFISRSVH